MQTCVQLWSQDFVFSMGKGMGFGGRGGALGEGEGLCGKGMGFGGRGGDLGEGEGLWGTSNGLFDNTKMDALMLDC